jgi:chromosome segregation ATPase
LCLGLLAVGATTGLRAQAPATPAPAAGDAVAALVTEVRALRTELAQVANASLRSQLLVTRIQLQEQRLMHLDRQRAEVAAKLGEAERMRTMFTTQMKQLENPGNAVTPEQRRDMQDGLSGIKPLLDAAQSSETTLRAEHETLLNAISTEQGRWSDFNGRLDELERSLPKAATR